MTRSGRQSGALEDLHVVIGLIATTIVKHVPCSSTLKYDGKEPQIEIALYEYGNDGFSSANDFIRQVAPLTTDLDLISEKLFALRTHGGSEYCGAVIQNAVKSLKWDDGNADMKLIYIAGNEPFNQGPINYKEAINHALTIKFMSIPSFVDPTIMMNLKNGKMVLLVVRVSFL